jgi:hypothetical protein
MQYKNMVYRAIAKMPERQKKNVHFLKKGYCTTFSPTDHRISGV